MSFFAVLRMAVGALASNRARSALTVLSITIGAFAIVLMSSLAESGLKTMSRGIEDIGGARILMVVPKQPERGQAKASSYGSGISTTDRDRVFEGLPHVVAASLFTQLGQSEVLAESGSRAVTSVIAGDSQFLHVFNMRMAKGRAFSEEENRGREAMCVVGPKLVDKLGLKDPLNKFLSVGALRCRISGVLADNDRFGVRFGFEWNDLVLVPSQTMSDRDPRVALGGLMLVQTDNSSSNDLVKRMIDARLSARHPGLDDFSIIDFSGFMKSWEGVNKAMEMIVAVLAGIALVVGGIGVMNMMLVAVSERVKEIGIRKALGARPRAIGAQFLAEAVMLSTFGGGVGVVLGLGTAVLASIGISQAVKNWQLSLAPWAPVSALLVTMFIGVAFGWLPAKKASRLDPIEAMRR